MSSGNGGGRKTINRYAERVGVDPGIDVYGDGRDRTPYGQQVSENRLSRIWTELMAVRSIVAVDKKLTHLTPSQVDKTWDCISAVSLGFRLQVDTELAGALILIYADGTVQLNHGGTEMGQGLHTKMRPSVRMS